MLIQNVKYMFSTICHLILYTPCIRYFIKKKIVLSCPSEYICWIFPSFLIQSGQNLPRKYQTRQTWPELTKLPEIFFCSPAGKKWLSTFTAFTLGERKKMLLIWSLLIIITIWKPDLFSFFYNIWYGTNMFFFKYYDYFFLPYSVVSVM